jgi:hypothetical protein
LLSTTQERHERGHMPTTNRFFPWAKNILMAPLREKIDFNSLVREERVHVLSILPN